MELEEIYRKDLNLLVALKVLLQEGSVSRAALRLNLSQSAMSRVLGRLRELLEDPLFTRQGQQLIPTPRALELNDVLDVPLASLGDLLTTTDFRPELCRQHFAIAATDYAMQTILPFALPRIYQEAPNISLEFPPVRHDQLLSHLSRGGADMAICRPSGDISPLKRDTLGQVGVFCLLAASHPLAGHPLTLRDYLDYPHALIAISDGVKALLDAKLADQPTPRLVLRAYHLDAALAIIDQIPLIITVPADLAYLVAARHGLLIKPLPFEFKAFDYSLLWHPRCDHTAAQAWMRNLIKEECGSLIAQRRREMRLV